jgi:excinuclease ABC subunit C
LFDIDRCSGPCVGAVSKDEYSALLADFSDVFNGKCVDVTSRLRREMESASSNLDFELAGRRRDQLKSLSIVGERQHVINPNGEDLDAIALAEDDLAGVVCVLRVRGGVLIGRRSLVIDKVEDASGSELMGKVLNQIYGSDEPAPRTVLVDTLPSELSECLGLLEQTRGGPVDLRAPKRGGKAALISTATTNAQEELSRLRLRRTSDHASRTRALYALGEALEMKQPPLRIECYDMSHLQGTDYVGSMVVLEDGVPAKGEYRKFTIKDVDGNDDYAAMEEVLTRRLTALLASRKSTIDSRSGKTESTAGAVQRHADHGSKSSKFSYPPQLILLDGGKGQLGVGVRVLAELGLTDEIAIASLAKSFEEVFVPGQSDPITIQRGNEALYILQRARDEAHRFAITTHRKKRGKRMTRGALDSVSGLGAKRRARLLRELGGVSGVRAASLEALTALPWLPNNIADGIFSSLHPEAH